MNSHKLIEAYLAKHSATLGFSTYATPTRLEDPRLTPCVSGIYISMWPHEGVYKIETLREIFRGIPNVRSADSFVEPSENEEALIFGKAIIYDPVGISTTVFTDENVADELRTERTCHETIVGICRLVPLVRLVEVILYPSEGVFKMDPDRVQGRHYDWVSKNLLPSVDAATLA